MTPEEKETNLLEPITHELLIEKEFNYIPDDHGGYYEEEGATFRLNPETGKYKYDREGAQEFSNWFELLMERMKILNSVL